jgi:uncharacterized membrane protein
MPGSDARLDAIEERLQRIEQLLGAGPDATSGAAPSGEEAAERDRTLETGRGRRRRAGPASRSLRAAALDPTRVMAWGASLAFVLAAGYFVKLVYDAGWLTPERQVAFAALVGLGLIGGGLALARVDRAYAAYMPAVGTVVLYLSIFAGHAFYGFFGVFPALAAVASVTLAALWLGRRFDASAYALLAVTGTYLTPLLIEATRASVIDLVVYFSAWGLLFSFIALQEARRATYLLALYFALLGFDIAFRLTDESDWAIAALYQFVQFVVFSAVAVGFSIRHQRPMRAAEAVPHGLALFYFYAIEFILLKENAPGLAPWLSLTSVLIVVALYAIARTRIADPASMRAGAMLASTYGSVVTAHIAFFELMPDGWHPWAALLLPVALGLSQRRLARLEGALLPALTVATLLFTIGFFQAVTGRADGGDVHHPGALLLLYAASLYGAYGLFLRHPESYLAAPLPLYAGHIALLTATVRLLDGALAVSIAWAVTAILLLVYAVRSRDKGVGQSSLVIFSASSLKVLLHDLSGSAPIIRVATLVVLAASLYAGGWLYQQMSRGTERLHPDPRIDEQLRLIRGLADEGLDDDRIAAELTRREVPRIGSDRGWDRDLVARIRSDYGFGPAGVR